MYSSSLNFAAASSNVSSLDTIFCQTFVALAKTQALVAAAIAFAFLICSSRSETIASVTTTSADLTTLFVITS